MNEHWFLLTSFRQCLSQSVKISLTNDRSEPRCEHPCHVELVTMEANSVALLVDGVMLLMSFTSV